MAGRGNDAGRAGRLSWHAGIADAERVMGTALAVPRRSVVLGGAAAGLALLLPGRTVLAAAKVGGLRLGDHGSVSRFVLDLSDPIPFSIFTLADPYRIVIDLPEVGWDVGPQALPSPAGAVEAVRYGLFQPGTSRIVLDCTRPVRIGEAFLLSPREGYAWRFVLDLAATDRATFLASAGPGHRVAVTAPGQAPQPPTDQAKAAPVDQPPLPQRKPDAFNRKPVIVLDPGHGGVDPGATGVSGIYEKHITLAMARELRQILEGTNRYKVVLTRDRDVFVRLRDRVIRARHAHADLFVSLHADSLGNSGVRGLSVYTLSENASDAEAAALAEAENKADLIAGVDFSDKSPEVANILIDLAQRDTMSQSVRFANGLIEELDREVELLQRARRHAGFAVLKAPDIPSVLVEMGYLSNRTEERLLRTTGYRAKLADAVVRTIDRHFAESQATLRP